MEIVILWFIFAFLASYYSSRKGNGWAGVLFISLLLSPLVGFIVAAIQKPDTKVQEAMAIIDGDQKKCLQCAELVKREAKICRFCQYRFVDAA
jgi:hypothetical protein